MIDGVKKKNPAESFFDTRYDGLIQQARETDGNVSSKVGTLNQMRNESKKFIKCFIIVTKGNYSNTWKNELRDFGLQKEKY